jgi:hypothetical protein
LPTWKSFDAFYADLARLGRDLTGPEKRKITREMGERAQKIAQGAANADIGGSFSGWPRDNPIELVTRVRLGRDFSAILTPTRQSAGPWTVAEFGRNSKAGPRMVGPRLTKTGKVSKARRRRYNGSTAGKKTASEAVAAMEKEIPTVAHKGVLAATRKRFDVT